MSCLLCSAHFCPFNFESIPFLINQSINTQSKPHSLKVLGNSSLLDPSAKSINIKPTTTLVPSTPQSNPLIPSKHPTTYPCTHTPIQGYKPIRLNFHENIGQTAAPKPSSQQEVLPGSPRFPLTSQTHFYTQTHIQSHPITLHLGLALTRPSV